MSSNGCAIFAAMISSIQSKYWLNWCPIRNASKEDLSLNKTFFYFIEEILHIYDFETKKVLFKCNFLLLPLGSQKIEYLKIQKGSVFIGFSLIGKVIVA